MWLVDFSFLSTEVKPNTEKNCIALLHEFCQREGWTQPFDSVVDETEDIHGRIFKMRFLISFSFHIRVSAIHRNRFAICFSQKTSSSTTSSIHNIFLDLPKRSFKLTFVRPSVHSFIRLLPAFLGIGSLLFSDFLHNDAKW